jgi:hypothetical protein
MTDTFETTDTQKNMISRQQNPSEETDSMQMHQYAMHPNDSTRGLTEIESFRSIHSNYSFSESISKY